jgi:hypothetical protein
MSTRLGDKLISGVAPNAVNKSLSNLDSTGQAILDNKVSKSDIWYNSTTSTLYIGVPQA